MKTKSLFLLIAFVVSGFWQQVSAQCSASFTMTQQTATTVSFTNTSTGNYSALTWQFGDGVTSTANNPTHTYLPGIYGVCLFVWDSLSGCQSVLCDTVVIANSTGCQAYFSSVNITGAIINFTDMSAGTGLSYSWTFGDGATSTLQNPSHTYLQSGFYSVCLTISNANGCSNTYCGGVNAQVSGSNCFAGFSAYDSSGMTWFFPAVYNPNYSYIWNFGDGNSSTLAYPIHQYTTPGTYLACLTVIDSSVGCTNTYCDSVSYYPASACIAYFNTQKNNLNVTFFGSNLNGVPVTSYSWNFGDGTFGSGSSPVHTYATGGIYNVCLTITTAIGCVDSVCNTVSVTNSAACNATFSYQSSNNAGYFFGAATGGQVTSWSWYFSDGTTASGQNPVHTFPSSGYWTACLFITTSSGCSDSTCQQVYIAGPISACQPYFSYSYLSGNTIGFNNQSVGNPTNYYWNFGDGATSTQENPLHNYSQNGTYYVCLTIIDSAFGCTATYCDTVIIGNILGNCSAQFQYYDSLNTYYFYSAGSPNYNYYWTFGDGTISYATNPTHVYSNPGGYAVCLTIFDSLNNCSDTRCDSIFINSASGCQAYFTFTVDTSTSATTFINQSQGNYTSSVWSFGDGGSSTSTNPVHTYTSPGTYLVCLTIYNNNGCQDSWCDSVVIGSGSNCIPQFYAVPDTIFGNGNVSFYLINPCSGWQYVWSFGDSTAVSGSGPLVHTYNASGWYIVCVTAYDSLGNTITWCDSVNAFRIGGSTGLSEVSNAIPMQIFPNPADGPFTLRFDLEKSAPITLDILSIQGQLIQHIVQDYPSGLSEIRLDPSMWDAGMYILRLRTAERQSNLRFTIQH